VGHGRDQGGLDLVQVQEAGVGLFQLGGLLAQFPRPLVDFQFQLFLVEFAFDGQGDLFRNRGHEGHVGPGILPGVPVVLHGHGPHGHSPEPQGHAEPGCGQGPEDADLLHVLQVRGFRGGEQQGHAGSEDVDGQAVLRGVADIVDGEVVVLFVGEIHELQGIGALVQEGDEEIVRVDCRVDDAVDMLVQLARVAGGVDGRGDGVQRLGGAFVEFPDGDVGVRARHAVDFSFPVAHVGAPAENPADRAVLVEHPVFHLELVHLAFQAPGVGVDGVLVVIRVDRVGPRLRQIGEFLVRIAEDFLVPLRVPDRVRRQIPVPETVVGSRDHQRVPLLALAQGLQGLLAVRDVDERADPLPAFRVQADKDVDPFADAVTGQEGESVIVRRLVPFQGPLPAAGLPPGRGFGVHEVRPLHLPGDGFRGIAREFGELGVAAQDNRVLADGGHGRARVFKQGAILVFAGA